MHGDSAADQRRGVAAADPGFDAAAGGGCRAGGRWGASHAAMAGGDGGSGRTRGGVVEAAERIAGLVERTPLIESEIAGTRVWLKCECLQEGGSFKLRGATNRLLQLPQEERQRGVVAFSSGNHARGVAIAARRLGIPAVIVMPADAPKVKIEGTRGEGAEIIFYDRRTESREG